MHQGSFVAAIQQIRYGLTLSGKLVRSILSGLFADE